MIRNLPKRLLASLALATAAATAASALTAAQQVKILQMNVEQAFLRHFLHDNGRLVHPAGGDIRAAGVRIVRATGNAFWNTAHFYVMNSAEVNAQTSPGGNVFLYQGLLNARLTQDETAAVLAHEIGHIMHMHWLSRLQRSIEARQLAAYTAKAYGQGSAQIAYLQKQLENLKYNREEEFQADETGARLMVGAGYNPQAMISLLNKVQTNQLPGQAAAAANPYLASHPAIPDRIARLQQLIQTGALRPQKRQLRRMSGF